MLKYLLTSGAAVALALTASGPASAQDASDAQSDRIAQQLDDQRTDPGPILALDGSGSATAVDLNLSLPAAFVTNYAYSDDDPKNDGHLTPAATLTVVHQLRGTQIDARATASSSNYLVHEESNQSFLRLRLQVTPAAGTGGFTPYLRYIPKVEFSDASFAHYKKWVHDGALGATGKVGGAKLDFYALRRWSTDPNSERWQPGGKISFEGPLGFANVSGLTWSASQTVEGRLYTASSNKGRDDLYAMAETSVSWKKSPNAPGKITVLQMTGELNRSDRPDRDFFALSVVTSVALTL